MPHGAGVIAWVDSFLQDVKNIIPERKIQAVSFSIAFIKIVMIFAILKLKLPHLTRWSIIRNADR